MTLTEFTAPHAYHHNRSSTGRWLLSHTVRHWWLVASMLLGATSNAVLAALLPVFTGNAFNAILENPPNLVALGRFAILILITQGARGGLQLARNFSAELIGQRLERDIRDELYANLLGKSMAFHNSQPVGDTMARATNDVREINLMFNPGFNLVIGSLNFLILPLIVAPTYHPTLLLTPSLFLVGYVLALWHYLRDLSPVSDSVREAFGVMNARLAEALDGIEIVKGTAREKREVACFWERARAFRNAFVHQGDIEARYLPLLLLGLVQGGALFHSLNLFRQGLLDVGQVVGFMGLIQLFNFPTFVSLFAYSQVSLGLASARRILELVNQETSLDRNPEGYSGQMRGGIEFRNVCFTYDQREASLEAASFRISPGQTVALAGQTGSGKSTLAKLINRTYDVTGGQILVDGIDVKDWDLEALRRQISIIEQDIFLFSRSLSENIAFGKPGASMEEIQNAARAAQAHEFITNSQQAYQTVVGERGVTLSGGQRQRIALARAFLTDPRILILDDSTSSIDSATEDQIQRAIFRAAQGRTTLIITHRLSQIRWADLIIVLRQGRISALGTHDELIESSEAYRRIFARYEDV